MRRYRGAITTRSGSARCPTGPTGSSAVARGTSTLSARGSTRTSSRSAAGSGSPSRWNTTGAAPVR
ncbi:MAG TPA: hypothetical protein VIG50_07860, partial [Vicinamibacteria bacterium]